MKLTRYERDALLLLVFSIAVPFFSGYFSHETARGTYIYAYDQVLGILFAAAFLYLTYRIVRRSVKYLRSSDHQLLNAALTSGK